MKKNRVCLALLLVFLITLVSCNPVTKTFDTAEITSPTTQYTVTTTPATFTISDFSVTPSNVNPDGKVTTSIIVTNIGGSDGSYAVILKVDDVEKERTEVAIKSGNSKHVDFVISEHATGNHNVSVGDQVGQFIVSIQSTPFVTQTATPTPTISLTDRNGTLSNPITYLVNRTLTVKNDGAKVVSVRIWLPLVVNWETQTDVKREIPIPNTVSSWTDSSTGNAGLFWEFSGKPISGSVVTVSDTFTYTCSEINYDIDSSKVGEYNKSSSDYQFYTRSEKYLEADDAEIKKVAVELQANKTNSYDVAYAIYEWVVNYMTYSDVDGLQGAKFALENKYGECGDYSGLFVALCRADGIPARPVVGRWATSIQNDWHVWAEFYLPNYGWIPVDPRGADADGNKAYHFGMLDNKRLIFHKGFNVTVQPKPVFIEPITGILQTFYWEWAGTGTHVETEINYTINAIH